MVDGVPTSLSLVNNPSDWAPAPAALTRMDADVKKRIPTICLRMSDSSFFRLKAEATRLQMAKLRR